MVIEEIMKTLKYEIERKIKEIKETKTTFTIYTTCGEIIADNYKFFGNLEEYMELYIDNKYIATINIWLIEDIE